MNTWQRQVQDFHEKFGVSVGTDLNMDNRELRAKLILEEAVETVAAMGYDVNASFRIPDEQSYEASRWVDFFGTRVCAEDIVEVVDGLADLIYVALGTAVSFGVDLGPIFDEVHRTNMAKDGGATRDDGKILKPDGWVGPDIAGILRAQAECE